MQSLQPGDVIEYDAITKPIRMRVVRVGSDGIILTWITDGGGVRWRSRSLVEDDIASGFWRVIDQHDTTSTE